MIISAIFLLAQRAKIFEFKIVGGSEEMHITTITWLQPIIQVASFLLEESLVDTRLVGK